MQSVGGVRDPRWGGLLWEPWVELDVAVDTRGSIPRVQGIYRVRSRGRRGLLYIGLSGSLGSRLRRLYKALNDPDGRWHYAGGCVAGHSAGRAVEVSWVRLEQIDRRELMGLEVDLIATYRASTRGKSPTCQFAGERLIDELTASR